MSQQDVIEILERDGGRAWCAKDLSAEIDTSLNVIHANLRRLLKAGFLDCIEKYPKSGVMRRIAFYKLKKP